MRIGHILILFSLGWLAFGAWGEVAVPTLRGRVTDEAKIFSAEDEERLEVAIVALEQATGGQMVVWTIPSLEGDTIESAGIRAADQWKIGREKEDDGAILLIAPNDREMRLEIGYGWEGPINDARAGDIIRSMAKFFRDGSYGDGSVYAVNKVQEFVTGKAPDGTPEVPQSDDDSYSEGLEWGIIIVFCVIIVIISFFSGSRFGTGGGRGGFRGGGFGGSGGGGGFSGGGGGGFGGGGASGKW